jgi:hypothetical protein
MRVLVIGDFKYILWLTFLQVMRDIGVALSL